MACLLLESLQLLCAPRPASGAPQATQTPPAIVEANSEQPPAGGHPKEPINAAEALEARGSFGEAAAIWQRILSSREQRLGSDHPDTATALHRLAWLQASLGQLDQAEVLYNRALAIRQQRLRADHPDLGATLNNLALLYDGQGRYQQAEAYYQRALEIADKALGAEHADLATGLNNLALLYSRQDRLSEAEPLLQRALAIREKALGPEHPETGTSIGNLAILRQNQGRYDEAERGYQQALKIHEASLGAQHPGTATSLNNLASFYDEIRGRHGEAEALYLRALAIHEQKLGPEHPLTATSLANLAIFKERTGRHSAAEKLFSRSLQIRQKALGPNHADTATSLHQLAVLHYRLGQYALAAPLLRRALRIYEGALGPAHQLVARSLNALASVYRAQARFDEAEDLYRRSLAIREQQLGEQNIYTATTLHELAHLYAVQGLYGSAEPLLRRALAIVESQLGPDHLNTAASLNDLGNLAEKQGRYAEAELLYARSLSILEKRLDRQHPDVATTLNNLALLHQKQGRPAAAEPLLELALQARQASLGAEHPDTASSLDHLAALYESQGRQSAAEELYQRALNIRVAKLAGAHPHVAASLNNLALFYERQGLPGKAEPLHRRALRLSEQAFGGRHPYVATSLNNLALLYASAGRLREAETMAQRALVIREEGLGLLHPDTATSLNSLASILLLQGRIAPSIPLLSRLARNQSDWLRRELPLQPRELRSSLLAQQEDAVASSFALLDLDPSGAPLALETRLNRQGLLAEIERRQQLLKASSAVSRALAERIAALDRQLALAARSRAEVVTLREQRGRLEGELHRLLPDLRMEEVSVSQVAVALRLLAPRGVLVEFQRYRPLQRPESGMGLWGADRYVALLLHADGRVVSIPLGEAAPIDQAVGRALAASSASRPEAADHWQRLSDRLFAPLLAELREVRELFLSPDGGLHRVPFAALSAPGDGGRLLSEIYALRLLTTGRDLLRLLQPAADGGPVVLIANPAYGARRSPERSAAKVGTAALLPASLGFNRQQRSGDLHAMVWTPLPGTAKEARALAPLLKVTRPITDEAATASLVLQQKGPRILHIATHGFFRADQPVPPGDRTGAFRAATISREDPLLRSGLVMAGANHPDADPTDDGYLTAAEVTGMNLNGTQLVTLSACKSGLGDLQTGEGVYGLQRALSVAGARSTLLSLWNVDDEGTRAFMEEYYGRLMRGDGRAAALSSTQAAFRRHVNPLFRNVYVWGAFQLGGDWRPIKAGASAASES